MRDGVRRRAGGLALAARPTWPEGAQPPEGAPEADVEVSVGDLQRVAATWRIPDDAGRRYAKVSGDVNPIHLSGLTAKAFGFKRAIAHGMWVKARVLGALVSGCPTPSTVDVTFRKPLFLPSTVTLSTAQADGGRDVAVRSPSTGNEHVVGDDPPALTRAARFCTTRSSRFVASHMERDPS